jgi:hypothetical protein
MQESTLVYIVSAGRQVKHLDDRAGVILKQSTIY